MNEPIIKNPLFGPAKPGKRSRRHTAKSGGSMKLSIDLWRLLGARSAARRVV